MTDLFAYFSRQLENYLPTKQGLAIALSGGADSWALALLTHNYCQANNLPFIALTVDHRLRPESIVEAKTIAAECTARGIPHATLVWQHDGIATRKQERARIARYELLGDYCAGHGFAYLLTAHHADDQAETVMLRFARGSGAKGLAGMAAARSLSDKITLLRPLLAVSKADLIAYAEAAGVPVTADSSNADPRYARARLRHARAVLEAEGLTTATLLKTAATAQAEDEALDYATQKLILNHATVTADYISLPLAAWLATPVALQMRALTILWRQLKSSSDGPNNYPPERDALKRLCEALYDAACRRTLGGLIIERSRNSVIVRREYLL